MNDSKKTLTVFVTVHELKRQQNVTEVFCFELACLCLNSHDSLEMVSGTSLPW